MVKDIPPALLKRSSKKIKIKKELVLLEVSKLFDLIMKKSNVIRYSFLQK